MKVLFLKNYQNNKKGQISEVNDGFAKNFLFPKGFATPATPQILLKIQKEAKELADKNKRSEEKANELKKNLEKRVFSIKLKASEDGKLFGSVQAKDIAMQINSVMNTEIEKSSVEMGLPIKSLGNYKIKINLSKQIWANVQINVEKI